jgi:hypothetical protein
MAQYPLRIDFQLPGNEISPSKKVDCKYSVIIYFDQDRK